MVNDLIDKGCVPKKSFTIDFPDISEKLIRHFTRGYFDGDGYIGCNLNSNRFRIKIATGSSKFFESVKTIIKQFTFYKDANTYIIDFGGIHQVNKFTTWIYQDSNIYLDRKYLRHLEIDAIRKVRYVHS